MSASDVAALSSEQSTTLQQQCSYCGIKFPDVEKCQTHMKSHFDSIKKHKQTIYLTFCLFYNLIRFVKTKQVNKTNEKLNDYLITAFNNKNQSSSSNDETVIANSEYFHVSVEPSEHLAYEQKRVAANEAPVTDSVETVAAAAAEIDEFLLNEIIDDSHDIYKNPNSQNTDDFINFLGIDPANNNNNNNNLEIDQAHKSSKSEHIITIASGK
jgi:hypothetical protein